MCRYPLFLLALLVACESPTSNATGTGTTTTEDCTKTPYFRDEDGDGFGTPTEQVASCTRPSGYAANNEDCDDANPDANPNSRWYPDEDGDGFGDSDRELLQCDGPAGYVLIDGDCDDTDDALTPDTTWYADTDSDTYGDPSSTQVSCEQPSGFVADSTDCDDTNDALTPDTTWYEDGDGDGFGHATNSLTQCDAPSDHVQDNTDCDDADGDAYPGATWYLDLDADGYGTPSAPLSQCARPVGYAGDNTDCDDNDAAINPSTTWYQDADTDGYGDPSNPVTQCVAPPNHVSNADDCNDGDIALNDHTNWYTDGDGDGYGAAIVGTGCVAPPATVINGGDCDDTSTAFSPGIPERCDGLDNDCDSATTEFEVVSFESASNTWTDLSALFASSASLPAYWDPSEPGDLHVCEGDYRVQIHLTHDVSIWGPGDSLASFSGGNQRTVVEVVGATVELHDLTLQDGAATPAQGGLVTVDNGVLLVSDATLTGDSSGFAGALAENNSVLTIDRTLIRTGLSFGLKVDGSEAFLNDSEITLNASGGVVVQNGSTLTMTDSLVHDHSSISETSRVDASDLICTATTAGTFGFVNNRTTLPGGTLQLSTGGTLTSNGCDWGSGGDDNTPADIQLTNGPFVNFNYGNDASFVCDSTPLTCTP